MFISVDCVQRVLMICSCIKSILSFVVGYNISLIIRLTSLHVCFSFQFAVIILASVMVKHLDETFRNHRRKFINDI